MKSPTYIWLGFVACLALALAAMAWVTATALRLDRAESAARAEAALEENVRLALWRMDSALAPLLAQESAQPVFSYRAFVPNWTPNGLAIPSPLLAGQSPLALVHFQFSSEGRLTSPEMPEGTDLPLAVPRYLSRDRIEATAKSLDRVRQNVQAEDLIAKLPEPNPAVETTPSAQMLAQIPPANLGDAEGVPGQMSRGSMEFRQRGAIIMNSGSVAQSQVAMQNRAVFPISAEGLQPSDLAGVPMTPLWVDDHLILARRVLIDGDACVQGCLLDWSEMESWLLLLVADLLPEASLRPAEDSDEARESRLLAALPVRLVPGRWAPATGADPSLVWVSLAAAWFGAALAMVAVAVLLRGVLQLSERRATFVSAVTHELRTPLTTFQMYTEMLAEGMVTDPKQQQEYLETLGREAGRLTHLVQNVLAYARLERGRTDRHVESLPLVDLIEPIVERLSTYAAHAGMQLHVDIDEHRHTRVIVNPSSVEQILVNLIDNAGKYAGSATDKRILLTAHRDAGRLQLRLRDHGPGVSTQQASRLFQAFSKSASDAAHSAPGVGLGLALSRRLARSMQADLFLNSNVTDGACFVLAIQAAHHGGA